MTKSPMLNQQALLSSGHPTLLGTTGGEEPCLTPGDNRKQEEKGAVMSKVWQYQWHLCSRWYQIMCLTAMLLGPA